MKDIIEYTEKIFEEIKHIDEYGNEYWEARELMIALDYVKWQKFNEVINKAIEACKSSSLVISDHFTHTGKMINIAKGGKRQIEDYKLSRYACYLIVQNGDSRKKTIALAQTYFAIQTRKQELLEEYDLLPEYDKRVINRKHIKTGNRILSRNAVKAGVKNLDKFHNAGYKGLYNGETADDIAKRKGLRYREDILDNMCSSELIANLFRIDQTNQKLVRDRIVGEKNACDVHYEVGKKVRNTIKELGGTMPEDLPTPKKSLRQLEKEELRKISGGCLIVA